MVAAERTQPVRTGRTPPLRLMGVITAVVIIGILAFIALQAWVSVRAPVHAGGFSAILGETEPCTDIVIGDDPSACSTVPFEEGREVGIGFTVVNDAPIAMTILDVEVIHDEVLTPAQLEPQLTGEETIFGLGEGVPFEPVEVPAGGERAIQFVGTYGDCESVARHYEPGGGLVVETAFLTVRWGMFQTDVEVPLMTALLLTTPDGCP
jgi:hypothetical protein